VLLVEAVAAAAAADDDDDAYRLLETCVARTTSSERVTSNVSLEVELMSDTGMQQQQQAQQQTRKENKTHENKP
jgi:hypothetical protein